MEHKNCLKKVTAVFSAHEAAPIWKLRHFAVLALLTEKPRRKSASLKRIFAFWGKVTSC